MSEKQSYGEELPCGGYTQEDKYIKNKMKILSQQDDKKPNHNLNNQNNSTIQCCGNCNSQNKINQSVNCCKQNQSCKTCPCDKQQQKKQKNCKNGQQCQNECKVKQQQTLKNQEIPVQQPKLTEERKVTKTICKKCKLLPSALLHKNQPICKDCLLKNIQYKCRLTLENTIKIKSDSRLLICFSGGLNSICLVHILSSLKKRYQKHHLFGELRCIHIQQQQKLPENYIQNFEKQTGINLEIVNIGQIFEPQNNGISQVRNIFSMFNKASNSADLLELFRDRLIVDYAKKYNFDFIFKGLNGETIATSIFKYFTKGVGGNVTQLSSIQPDSLYHYPLRQHLQKQLQFYFYALKCSKLSLISLPDDLSNFTGSQIDNGLSDFILSLQTMYSHTAPAITRTSQKIQSNRKNQIRCKWCMLKGVLQDQGLCRKCSRIRQNKTKLYDNNKVPAWFRIQN